VPVCVLFLVDAVCYTTNFTSTQVCELITLRSCVDKLSVVTAERVQQRYSSCVTPLERDKLLALSSQPVLCSAQTVWDESVATQRG